MFSSEVPAEKRRRRIRSKTFVSSSSSPACNLCIEPLVSGKKSMELISPRPLTGERELKQELFLRAEELERLVAVYKLKLCGDGINSLNYGTNQSLEKRFTEVSDEQRGQFYDLYMKKRELKLREEWQAKGARKEAEMKTMMESLDSASSKMMSNGKATEPRKEHSGQTHSRKSSSSSSVASSTSQSSATTALNPTIRPPLKGAGKGSSLQRSIERSRSSRDRMGLAKEIRASRSQSMRKNSAREFMLINPDSGAGDPLMMKSIGRGSIDGDGGAKLRISMASLDEKEGNLRFDSHDMDRYMDGEAGRGRKKWGSVERPFPAADTIARSTMDGAKGMKRLLKFGEKIRGFYDGMI